MVSILKSGSRARFSACRLLQCEPQPPVSTVEIAVNLRCDAIYTALYVCAGILSEIRSTALESVCICIVRSQKCARSRFVSIFNFYRIYYLFRDSPQATTLPRPSEEEL